MHVITGLAVAGLMRLKRRRKKPGRPASIFAGSLLPMLRHGPVQTAHALPGRVRFHVPSLVAGDTDHPLAAQKLSQIQGVDSVRVNAATGSVLIGYRPEEVGGELLFAAVVRLFDLEKQLNRPPEAKVTKEFRAAFDALNRAVYDRTAGLVDLWSALLILMAAVGTKRLVTQRAGALPGGFTLVWWALDSLTRNRRE